MRYIRPYKLYEKSTLASLGIPKDVIRDIQRNYEISRDAEWGLLKFKKDVISTFKSNKNKLVICIDENISVFFSLNREYFLDQFIFKTEDDFGNGSWEKQKRIQLRLSEIQEYFTKKNNYFELSGDWKYDFASKRKLKAAQSEFETETSQFKDEFAREFTRIVRKLYGKKAEDAQNTIIHNLQQVNNDLSPADIKKILYINVQKAKEVDQLQRKKDSPDPFNLYSDIIGDNSLTIFDEYLISFESAYSDKYNEYLTIPSMIKKYGREKIMTVFMIYLTSEKLIEL